MGSTFMFMLAVLLLMTGTIGGVRAAPQIFNPDFAYSGLELDEIGITLRENGEDVASRDYNRDSHAFVTSGGSLLTNMLTATDGKVRLGWPYTEALTVYNSGEISEYVRVTIYKYWTDKNGDKYYGIPNDLIKLNLVTGNGWVIDDRENSSTSERTVLYYQSAVAKGVETKPFTDLLTIDNRVIDYVDIQTTTYGKTVTWVADGKTFQIEVEADGVQDHNARAAMKSAWGLTNADITRLGLNVPADDN